MKLKNSNFDETQKINLKLKISNWGESQKLKWV